MAQVHSQPRADVARQRKAIAAVTLAADSDLPREVVELHGNDLTGADPEGRQYEQDRVVALKSAAVRQYSGSRRVEMDNMTVLRPSTVAMLAVTAVAVAGLGCSNGNGVSRRPADDVSTAGDEVSRRPADDASTGGDEVSRRPGDDASTGGDEGLTRLEFIRFTQGGANCLGDCSTVHAVESPAKLVIEDAEGELVFSIEPEEFEQVADLARSPEFSRTVEDSLAGRDCGGSDILLSMTYQWSGGPPHEVPHVDSCGVRDGYVLRDILQSIHKLKQKYLQCPPWQDPPGFALATDPLPQRALCYFCYGKCGGGQSVETPPP